MEQDGRFRGRVHALWSKRSGTWAILVSAAVLLCAAVGLLADFSAVFPLLRLEGFAALGLLVIGLALLLAQRKAAKSGTRNRRTVIAGVTLMVLGVVAGGFVAWVRTDSQVTTVGTAPATSSVPAPAPPAGPTTSVGLALPQGSFEIPAEGAIVQQQISAHGTITGLRDGHQLILLLLYDNCYFPDHTQVAGNFWSGETQAGADEAKGKSVTLNLVDLGPNGVIALKKYEAAETAAGSALGICNQQELAEAYEATIITSVHITRAP